MTPTSTTYGTRALTQIAFPAGSYPSPVICDCDFTVAISSRATRVEQSSVVTRPGALPPPGNTGVRSAGSKCGWGVNPATGLGLSSSTSLPSTINGGRSSVPAPSASAGTWGWWDSPSTWCPEGDGSPGECGLGRIWRREAVHVTQQRTMVRGEHRRRHEPRGGTPSRRANYDGVQRHISEIDRWLILSTNSATVRAGPP
jgi:hypothetical protein